jgi:hypothetical protein
LPNRLLLFAAVQQKLRSSLTSPFSQILNSDQLLTARDEDMQDNTTHESLQASYQHTEPLPTNIS